jgi:hypothetical protein
MSIVKVNIGLKDYRMHKLRDGSNGFAAIEVMLIVLALAVVSFGGYYVWHSQHKAKSPSIVTTGTTTTPVTTKTTASTANPYAGWQSFCSNYGDLCLKYPSSWTIKTTSEPVSTTENIDEADITSPSGGVTVEYQPYCTQLVGPPAGTYTDNVLSVSSPTSTTDFKVIKNISAIQFSNSGSTTYTEGLYITSNAVVVGNGITVGSHTNTTGDDDEASAGFFVNAKSSVPSNLQCIDVSSNDSSPSFSDTSDVQAWFNTSEAQTADQILSSLSYN